jgi:hypothetical protein
MYGTSRLRRVRAAFQIPSFDEIHVRFSH